jgi:hypothetical protein
LSVGRLRGGELLVGLGAVVLLVSLFLPWFGVDFGSEASSDGIVNLVVTTGAPAATGWNTLGWLVLAVAAAAIALGGWLVVATATVRPVTQVVAADVLTASVAPIALLTLLLRALVFQPGPNELTTIRYGAWIGLVGAAALTVGAWWSLADERTDAPESAYVPPAPRPAPPAHSS